jgi:chromosome partitioning protein
MKVITVACAKGGSTKSTIATGLAVRATRESARVAMFDLNADQSSLTQWWVLRGEPLNPQLREVDSLARDVERLREEKFEWLLIDTPPLDMDLIEASILKSDAVVIPVRCSLFDVGSVTPIVEMCREHKKPFKFLLSAVDGKMPKLTEQTLASLVSDGEVFGTRISYRQAYISAVAAGKVGFEVEKALTIEFDNLWAEIKRLASDPLMAMKAKAANA